MSFGPRDAATVSESKINRQREGLRDPDSSRSDRAGVAEGNAALKAPASCNEGKYNDELCQSHVASEYSVSDASDDSMNSNKSEYTPPESPGPEPPPVEVTKIAELSLEDNVRSTAPSIACEQNPKTSHGNSVKRPASEDLSRDHDGQSSGSKAMCASRISGPQSPSKRSPPRRRSPRKSPSRSRRSEKHDDGANMPGRLPSLHETKQSRQDSGYISRKTTMLQTWEAASKEKSNPVQPKLAATAVTRKQPNHVPTMTIPIPKQTTIITVPQKARWPGLILQPDSSTISEDQLTAEIKGIYAGLVIVEAKCINIDKAQASDLSMVLDASQWQALIALHRTLLYEHHDFMMATQHPSATPALRALPVKYSMPARMWKHGIHAFLEVLRHRRPDSQDYMMSFIYLAYQMTTLLYETIPIFLDTWIECLGDLARYRMAIEEDREPHAQWGAVAASWYLKASDRHPQVGRLYHHLAILERPSLRKVACYGKSLTCVVPFANANDSLRTLYGPLAQQSHLTQSPRILAEACFCKLHAVIFLAKDDRTIRDASVEALGFLQQPKTFSWRDCGSSLAVANISPLLMFGAATNPLRMAFDVAIRNRLQRSETPTQTNATSFDSIVGPINSNTDETRRQLSWSKDLLLASVHTAMQCPPGTAAFSKDSMAFRDTIAFVGVMMCFLSSLSWLYGEMAVEAGSSVPLPLRMEDVAWPLVATYLNRLARLYPITINIIQCAQQGVWPEKAGVAKPLPEDWMIRGLVWTFWEFCPGWFILDEDEEWPRSMDAAGAEARAMRPLYYGLRIVFQTSYLAYEAKGRGFWTDMKMPTPTSLELDVTSSVKTEAPLRALDRSTTTFAGSPSLEGDFVHVRRPSKPSQAATARTYASVAKASPKVSKNNNTKKRQTYDDVKVFDSEASDYEVAEA
ncbi:hypothetical protein LTR78_003842 [Recurvomyces mirabilis]|uniref:DNA/RNA-binding domain-containing protein n=1 Tax=Recurvomyces mirabilis TaxID=574656 RepID=A0AAE1C353_9PEZI|nr:hypothetical protein LTR78_003842 [Recurvomyces mirabilis]KAK5154019.1 hypothetical protein LTS14_007239 [Recurvomyces mirabilis]